MYIGSSGTAASYLIHLSADSAGKPGGGSWTNSSDARLKNILGEYTRGLDELRRLRPIRYRYNGEFNTPTEPRLRGLHRPGGRAGGAGNGQHRAR